MVTSLCGCDKLPRQMQFEEGFICMSSEFKGTIHHGRKDELIEIWSNHSISSLVRKKWAMNTPALLDSLFLRNLEPSLRNGATLSYGSSIDLIEIISQRHTQELTYSKQPSWVCLCDFRSCQTDNSNHQILVEIKTKKFKIMYSSI